MRIKMLFVFAIAAMMIAANPARVAAQVKVVVGGHPHHYHHGYHHRYHHHDRVVVKIHPHHLPPHPHRP